jgi:hypothetical protein
MHKEHREKNPPLCTRKRLRVSTVFFCEAISLQVEDYFALLAMTDRLMYF